MKINVKLIAFLGISLFLVIVFSTLLLPDKGQVRDSITIYASDSLVKSKLESYASYAHWFPWIGEGPKAMTFLKDESNQIKGFSFKGKGEKKGSVGRYFIKENQGDSILHYSLYFESMPKFYGVFLIKGNDKKTIVAWQLNMDAGWKPWWRFYAAMMTKITKPSLTNGLKNLKKICEQK